MDIKTYKYKLYLEETTLRSHEYKNYLDDNKLKIIRYLLNLDNNFVCSFLINKVYGIKSVVFNDILVKEDIEIYGEKLDIYINELELLSKEINNIIDFFGCCELSQEEFNKNKERILELERKLSREMKLERICKHD